MPFRLLGAPATFQLLVDSLIGPDIAYLDEIVIVNETFKSYQEWVAQVIDRFQGAGLTINIKRCVLGRLSIRHLGFLVNQKGLAGRSGKSRASFLIPSPKNNKTTETVLGNDGMVPSFHSQLCDRRRTIKQVA
ncbi:uncharacterized protein LOC117171099 [Belonocnema kinseyi]|uniref:uncharacterized protein LOC117171099 n=1 Tax=Belonocnema kinseyi TaxID=2817044 RepID=UPI00143D8F7A|nr:uncharacterized protein LOC117171099 [Belonocnema kinseyi]